VSNEQSDVEWYWLTPAHQMPIQIFKNVIAANQCPVDPAGPTLRQSGHDIAAAYIDVSPSILEAVRRHTGIRSAVLEPQMTIIT
jgi:N-acyl-L-homoserine lactone synthetase